MSKKNSAPAYFSVEENTLEEPPISFTSMSHFKSYNICSYFPKE